MDNLSSLSPSLCGIKERRTHLPGEAGIWVLIAGDMMIFALFFATFVFYRAQNSAIYINSQILLNQNYGAINTLLLLTSSWFVVIAVSAARAGRGRVASRLLSLSFLCGLGFAVVKFLEYSEKLQAGVTISTNDFFMFYFVLTGIHFMHLLIGMAGLAYLIAMTRGKTLGDKEIMVLEAGASFWHMVDLLWIVLFPLLYLMR
jgi:nitric oxide reductase NorE protein